MEKKSFVKKKYVKKKMFVKKKIIFSVRRTCKIIRKKM